MEYVDICLYQNIDTVFRYIRVQNIDIELKTLYIERTRTFLKNTLRFSPKTRLVKIL